MENILIIDDSELIRAFLRVGLKKTGYDVLCLENGSIALNALKADKVPPKLIFVDVNMPTMNGYAFARILKNDIRFKLIPIYFLTANDSQWDKDHAKDCGAAGYIVKPCSIETILDIVLKYLPK